MEALASSRWRPILQRVLREEPGVEAMVWRGLFSLAVMVVDAFALVAHSAAPAPSSKSLGLSEIDHPVAIPQREKQ